MIPTLQSITGPIRKGSKVLINNQLYGLGCISKPFLIFENVARNGQGYFKNVLLIKNESQGYEPGV
jgi:hypothetical protein